MLSWNLYHGRSDPPARRPLEREFSQRLAGWPWDVALLQEVPPWWGPVLGRACDAQVRSALTSRNALPWLRRFVADRWPDLIKSGGGGANVILVRGESITEHRVGELSTEPERRVVHAVRLASGRWVANIHTQGPDELALADAACASELLRGWAGDAPVLLGGDLNVRRPRVAGFDVLAGEDVDHFAARGLQAAGPLQLLERGALSDHAPLLLELRRAT